MHRKVTDATDALLAGRLSRRSFVTKLVGLGISGPAISSILASVGYASPVSRDVQGHVRFFIGPCSDNEVKNQQHAAASFRALYPNVTFEFRLYQWETASQEINTSVASGAHDIYMTVEGSYAEYEAGAGFSDLTARINDPSFASEKGKYLYLDRIASFGPKLLGLPMAWHVEDALFVNMDMVNASGYDETFVDKWDTFVDCVTKMTKPGKTYGLGLGLQISGYGEWYQLLRSAGGSYLTPDLKSPNVNLPAVVEITRRHAELFKEGIAPPLGTFSYDAAPGAFAAARMAIMEIDHAACTVLPAKVPFKWKFLSYPPGPVSRVNFNDLAYYMINAKSSNQDLLWEVVKWWTDGANDAYWADRSGTYPARADAVAAGYGTISVPQLAEAFPMYAKYSVGPENFTQWFNIENLVEPEIQNCYAGKTTPAEAVAKVEKIIKDEAGL